MPVLALLIVLSLASGALMGAGFAFRLLRAGGWPNPRGAAPDDSTPGGQAEEFDLAEIKRAVRTGTLESAWPDAAMLFGFLGLLAFGSLALSTGVGNPVVGALIVLPAGYALARIGWALHRA